MERQKSERRPGRPRTSKKNDPKYTAISGYVLKETRKATEHFMIDNDEFKDFGDVLDAALQEFLTKQKRRKTKEI